MSSELTDRELVSLYLDRNDKKALDTLIARHHHDCFEKINSHYEDESQSLNLCKQLWVSILINNKNLHHEDIDNQLNNAIDALLIKPVTPIEQAVDTAHLLYQNDYENSRDPQSVQPANEAIFDEATDKSVNTVSQLSRNSIVIGIALLAILAGLYFFNGSKPQLLEPNSIVSTYSTEQLRVTPDFLSENIITNIDWQYGFVIEAPSAHDAFVVGSYMVDLVNLEADNHSGQIKEIVNQLKDIHLRINNDDIQSAFDYLKENPVTKQAVINLVSAFENFYADHSEQNYFRFGKWVEYNFLFTKLSIQLDDAQIYSENLYNDNHFLKHFLSAGNHPQLVKKDIKDIEALSLDSNASIEKLKQQFKILGNLRSLLF